VKRLKWDLYHEKRNQYGCGLEKNTRSADHEYYIRDDCCSQQILSFLPYDSIAIKFLSEIARSYKG
jgi:hypothetical protein